MRKHNVPGDCWLVIHGKVYDVSRFNDHPGGKVLLTHAGSDATDVFTAFHSKESWSQLDQFYIGECREPVLPFTAFEADFRNLVRDAIRDKLYESSPIYYVYKFFSTTALALLGAAICYYYPSFWMKMLGGLLIGLFWQQTGWLAHDLAHHQVFKNRTINDMGTLVMSMYLGFSCDWWKNKHNTHHAIPNVTETSDGAHDGDPDIDTLPFIAWSKKMVRKILPGGSECSSLAQFCVKHQALFYFPLLLFARLIWAAQSYAYVFRLTFMYWGATDTAATQAKGNDVKLNEVKLRYEVGERIALSLHALWYFGLMYYTMDPLTAFAFFCVSQMSCGLFLAIAFGVGHNGMAVYNIEDRRGFAEMQVTTTRDVVDTAFNSWFTGGLHFQIEHHLFLSMPRHNLRKIAPRVRALCKKHNMPYHCTGLYDGTVEIIHHLKDVAKLMSEGPM